MIYVKKITTPANTTKLNAVKTTLKLTKGVIHQVDVQFPPGSSALAHCVINLGRNQIWPTNANESFSSDNVNISFKEDFPLSEPPFLLDISTWNLDDTFSHDIITRFGLLVSKTLLERLF